MESKKKDIEYMSFANIEVNGPLGQEAIKQALEFSLRNPAFVDQLRESGEIHNEEVIEGVKQFARQCGVSETVLANFHHEKEWVTDDEVVDESAIPLDSGLGQSVDHLVNRYFPGSVITTIASDYHRGVFAGDYSITLDVALTHPTVQRVGISFDREDIPTRPGSWHDLLSTPNIVLFLESITLINYINNQPITYALPGLYQEEIKHWYSTLDDDGGLYGHYATPDLFIITTRGVDNELLERTVDRFTEEYKQALEARKREWESSAVLSGDDEKPF